MSDVKDKLVTAENLKNAYDDNKRQITELKSDIGTIGKKIVYNIQSKFGSQKGWLWNEDGTDYQSKELDHKYISFAVTSRQNSTICISDSDTQSNLTRLFYKNAEGVITKLSEYVKGTDYLMDEDGTIYGSFWWNDSFDTTTNKFTITIKDSIYLKNEQTERNIELVRLSKDGITYPASKFYESGVGKLYNENGIGFQSEYLDHKFLSFDFNVKKRDLVYFSGFSEVSASFSRLFFKSIDGSITDILHDYSYSDGYISPEDGEIYGTSWLNDVWSDSTLSERCVKISNSLAQWIRSIEDRKEKAGKWCPWFGTSIPAGDGTQTGAYPYIVGKKLGLSIHNEAIGSSCVRAGSHIHITENDPMGYAGKDADTLLRSFSLSSTEKQEIFNNWEKWKAIIPNASTELYDESTMEFYKSCSYDKKLNKFLSTPSFYPNAFIIDHGFNDRIEGDDLTEVPSNPFDRTYFVGAMNFIIRQIFNYDPFAKVILIGHYSNTDYPQISKAQEIVANYWGVPLEKTWERANLSTATILTSGDWVNGIWTDGVTDEREVTLINRYMPDGVHPHLDLSKKCINHLANIHAEFLRKCVF